ncbi:hypothetical protein PFTANZ_05925, partial [Plasmodium falciparum Tanzania (2000708)]
MPTTQKKTSGENKPTTLTDFISRPPYFRYLEEWGQHFCKKKKDKLAKVKEKCQGYNAGGHKIYCSGDGYDCTRDVIERNEGVVDLDCPDCEKACAHYKKWIKNKEKEFNKQKEECENEFNKHLKENGYSSVENFLASLNNCKNGEHDKNQTNKIDFKNLHKTFGTSEYCKACPVYGVSLVRGKYQPIFKNDLTEENDNIATEINVHVLGRKGNDIDQELHEVCKNTGLFEDASVQKWNCQKKNGVDQCKLTNFLKTIDEDEDIVFNELFQRWIKDFLEHYYKTNKQMDVCNKKEQNKCQCIGKWVEKKKNEWEKIKTYFNKQNRDEAYNIKYTVRSFFQRDPFFSAFSKAMKGVHDIKGLQELKDCTNNVCRVEKIQNVNHDFIEELLRSLEDKIKKCNSQPDGSDTLCVDLPRTSTLTTETLDPLVEEETEPLDDYYIQQPNFCPPPMTCVEKVAKELRVEAEENANKYDSSLKGKGKDFKSECNKVKKENGTSQEDLCKFEKTYEKSMGFLKQTCNNNGKERFKIGQKWNSEYIRRIGKDLYMPPRKKDMCIINFQNITTRNITNSTKLLHELQEVAQNEGDDIIKNLLPENPCNESTICDAMKYSFADLGDIIRGTDLWNKNIKPGIQTRLENIFRNIYITLKKENQNKYEDDFPYYYKLRSDWWDANRKHIWNAMTCNAPDAAKFLKKDKNFSSGKFPFYSNGVMSNDPNCGHKSEPPDYDYIPQPFRFMQEWSESFCKLLNKEIEQFEKECKDCKNHGMSCKGDVTGTKCERCKEQCEKYKKLIHNWKLGFDKYKEIYNEIYNNKESKINSNEYITKFLKKLKRECKDPQTADKYLHEATQCTNYGFLEIHTTHEKYAFKNPPKGYEEACKCEPPDTLDQCPDDDKHENVCKNLSITTACRKKYYNHDDSWNTQDVKDSKGKNKGVLVPPRRRHLCLRNINWHLNNINNKADFRNKFLQYVYTEGKFVGEKYKNDNKNALDAMRYSFYDYGDIIKGTDMLDTTSSRQINKRLTELLNASKNGPSNVGSWWTENKKHIWYAMLCGYQKENKDESVQQTWCTLPTEDKKTPQFLRWFQEWTQHFCTKRNQLYQNLENQCKHLECNKNDEGTGMTTCKRACQEYSNYISTKKHEYELLNYQYEKNFMINLQNKKAPEYYKDKCNNKCNCFSEYFSEKDKWENPYDTFDDDKHKDKCDCQKTVPPPLVPPPPPPKPDELPDPADQPFDPTILQTTIPFGVALALGSIAFLFLK